MIDLQENLSEFTYGYGVTREVENMLKSINLSATPFFPNLRHEGKLGFDMGINTRGCVVLLQFKLGQELQRYRSQHPQQLAPQLERPFWRFKIPMNQFESLLKFENKDANVFYIAPRFSCWTDYKSIYRGSRILKSSIILSPLEIQRGLNAQKGEVSDRVVYDKNRSYVCSDPIELHEVTMVGLKQKIEECVRTRNSSIESKIESLFHFVVTEHEKLNEGEFIDYFLRLLDDSKTRHSVNYMANLIGLVALDLGAQLVFVTE